MVHVHCCRYNTGHLRHLITTDSITIPARYITCNFKPRGQGSESWGPILFVNSMLWANGSVSCLNTSCTASDHYWVPPDIPHCLAGNLKLDCITMQSRARIWGENAHLISIFTNITVQVNLMVKWFMFIAVGHLWHLITTDSIIIPARYIISHTNSSHELLHCGFRAESGGWGEFM